MKEAYACVRERKLVVQTDEETEFADMHAARRRIKLPWYLVVSESETPVVGVGAFFTAVLNFLRCQQQPRSSVQPMSSVSIPGTKGCIDLARLHLWICALLRFRTPWPPSV